MSLQPLSERRTIVLLLWGSIDRGDVPGLCRSVRLLLECSGAEKLVCDVRALGEPDLVTLDALARLQLTAVRLGRQIRLRHACADLQDLVDLAGLGDALPLCADSGVEPRGEPEEREQAPRIQEEADPGDPVG